MRKFGLLMLLAATFCACGRKDKTDQDLVAAETTFEYQKMPTRVEINTQARDVLDQWEEFGNLSRSFGILYQAQNNEDLKLAIDDLLEKEKLLSESEYPEVFDKLQIKSRQRVLRTFLLKVQADCNQNRNATESVRQLLDAYNALRTQFNVIVNNRLELELILDDE